MDQNKLQIRKRIFHLFLIVVFIMFMITLRLSWIQVFNNDFYQSKALDQRLRKLKVEPRRGIIYDRNQEELAVSVSADTVVAVPPEIKNPKKVAEKLALILDMSQEDIYKRVTKNAYAVYLERKVSEEKAKRIKSLDLAGITFTEESKRFYPKGELASHILGFAGIDSQGLNGIELSYDQVLRGRPGRIMIEKDATGQQIPEGVEKYLDPKNGNNIYLTIDHVIQYIVERELEKAMRNTETKDGTIIVMNPQNGEILAMANRPAYNPNKFAKYSPGLWRNAAISNTYEPGSTFKIITTASGLEEGVVNPKDRFFDPGYIKVGGEIIRCWKDGGHGSQSFAEVVENSCNPGFVQVGQRIGKKAFYKYIKAFGFGQETDIRLPGEASGLVYDYDEIGPVELATMSFGHGISVTPIQLITAVSAVANDGVFLKPRLVDKIENSQGEIIKEFKPEVVRQVVSKETAKTTRELLAGVVANGSGKKAQVKGYRIGGKTGTAKHYGVKAYDSSFIGLLPVDNPKLVVLVAMKGVTSYPYYGSQLAAPIFHNIVKDVVRYLELPPSQEEEVEEGKEEIKEVGVPNLVNQSLREVRPKLKNLGLNFKIEGNGNKVLEQIPTAGAKVDTGTTIILFTSDGLENQKRYKVTIPDLEGMKLEEAQNLLAELGLQLEWQGSGEIIRQQPAPGFRIKSGTTVKVKLH
ncbi:MULTISPECIES: stage V sporulation protein D [unclassified Candidatus Frackibacter]|uniref:stage V sporulation protein D n=1 Tax=unclassified Candidatus Frackibacter TaxID=2648818 RepID=UPI00088E2D1F|nr:MULTISPECIES: stage V sporulation protein D [unclassified Candidatus Frackibacter]SDC35222.1 stage V sporulation protein D (sporulation-specific penicillin-binding protein) [Candidatus Frackibacter sp. WG11]SEM56195.1 stage V sporulation protein D (sporulation-specific penicillin-binding protein) [Candidatus Frackibacter sp. WG12]SFL71118.1 stage V sporulation protein D (sporulation-specific penicillin-binding protein) [Candidatus Frackibacter sp. WG13]